MNKKIEAECYGDLWGLELNSTSKGLLLQVGSYIIYIYMYTLYIYIYMYTYILDHLYH